MCGSSADLSFVDFGLTYELADIVLSHVFAVPQRFRRSNQRLAGRPSPGQPHCTITQPNSRLKQFTAPPLHTLMAENSSARFRMAQLQESIKPKGPGCNDKTRGERLLNTLTSLPVVVIGLHTMRERKSPEGVQFGASLLGVGIAATAYHASSGRQRKHLRKLDYWSISLSTTAAVRAALPAKSQAKARLASVALLALTPFQPSAVTAINASIAQVEFAKCSQRCPQLRTVHRRQAVSLAAGLTCFGLEDMALQRLPCTSAYASKTPMYASKSTSITLEGPAKPARDKAGYRRLGLLQRLILDKHGEVTEVENDR